MKEAANGLSQHVQCRNARIVCAHFALILLTGCGTMGRVSGRYVDKTGKGISGARVEAWTSPPVVLRLFPVLPGRAGEATTDADGRFEIVPRMRADSVVVKDGEGFAEERLWWWSSRVTLQREPYAPPDYSEMNRRRARGTGKSVTVLVRGAVQNPGTYSLKANDSAWAAIEAAGGAIVVNVQRIDLVRKPNEGTVTVHFLDWARREGEKVRPLLCDGDEIVVHFPPVPESGPSP